MPRDPITVFYSWASDFPNATNRQFIYDALERAIEGMSGPHPLLEVRLDQDTAGVTGAPDIAQTILSKIESAHIVVSDVSILGEGERRYPNGNVMFELGFAIAQRRIGWTRVIPVLNTVTGSIEELPFDIRGKRVLDYQLGPGDAREPVRAKLVSELRAAIEGVVRELVEDPGALRRQNSPNLSVEWAGPSEEPLDVLLVPPVELKGFEGWMSELEAGRPDPPRLALLHDRWDRVKKVLSTASRSVHKIQEPPKSLDAVEAMISKFNDALTSYIDRARSDPRLHRFGEDLRERAIPVRLLVKNTGTTVASDVRLLVRPTDRVRFFTKRDLLVKHHVPLLGYEAKQCIEIAESIELYELRARASGLHRLAELSEMSIASAGVPFMPSLNLGSMLAAREAPWIKVKDEGVAAGIPRGVPHGFNRCLSDEDVFLVHALEDGETATLPVECHATNLPDPERCELVVRAGRRGEDESV